MRSLSTSRLVIAKELLFSFCVPASAPAHLASEVGTGHQPVADDGDRAGVVGLEPRAERGDRRGLRGWPQPGDKAGNGHRQEHDAAQRQCFAAAPSLHACGRYAWLPTMSRYVVFPLTVHSLLGCRCPLFVHGEGALILGATTRVFVVRTVTSPAARNLGFAAIPLVHWRLLDRSRPPESVHRRRPLGARMPLFPTNAPLRRRLSKDTVTTDTPETAVPADNDAASARESRPTNDPRRRRSPTSPNAVDRDHRPNTCAGSGWPAPGTSPSPTTRTSSVTGLTSRIRAPTSRSNPP